MTRKLFNDGKMIDISGRMDRLRALFAADHRIVAAYIYGSYGTPDQTPLSDIDLAVLYHPDARPPFDDELRLIVEVTAAAGVDDISVMSLNRLPVVSQFNAVAEGRLIFLSDAEARADFLERVFKAYGDYEPRYRHVVDEYDRALVEAYVMGQETSVDLDKIRVKLQQIRDEVKRLSDIKDRSEAEFLATPFLEPAATRMLQIAIEAMIDIGNHIIAREGLGVPHAYRETIEILVKHGILPASEQQALINMIRFRNRAVHLYDEIDPAEVYRILQNHLPDFERFIRAIVKRYFASRFDA